MRKLNIFKKYKHFKNKEYLILGVSYSSKILSYSSNYQSDNVVYRYSLHSKITKLLATKWSCENKLVL